VSIMDGPKVSVGLPVYNGQNYLAESIESILAQTHSDLELIISDNASTDDTEEISRSFAAADDRVRYYRNDTNVGANPNYNRTFALARGSYFKWQAHDDICAPKYLELCLNALENDPSISLAHTKTVYIDRTGERMVPVRGGFVDTDGYVERLIEDPASTELLASPDVHTRFNAVVNHMSVFYDVFGLATIDTFRRTMLLPNYYGADKVFLAEITLLGRLVRVDEEAFMRRCHAETSTRSAGLRSLAGWSDAAKSVDYFPALMIKGYVEAVRSADLTRAERRRCGAVIARKFASPYKLLRGR